MRVEHAVVAIFREDPDGQRNAEGERHHSRVLRGIPAECKPRRIAAKHLQEEPLDAVGQNVIDRREAFRPPLLSLNQNEQNREEDDIRLTFPNHRRPQRLCAILGAGERSNWEEHAKVLMGWASIRAPVHKVSISSDAHADDETRHGQVQEVEKALVVSTQVEPAGDQSKDNATLN